MSHTIYEWIGVAISFLIVVAVVLACLGALISISRKMYDKAVEAGTRKQMREFGQYMRYQHHWLSANPREAKLWAEVADAMRDGRMPDASIIREKLDVPN